MTIKCPRCFQTLPTDRAAFACSAAATAGTTCKPAGDRTAAVFTGTAMTAPSGQSRPISIVLRGDKGWRPPTAFPCAVCQRETNEICPTCHYVLPAGWRQAAAICIGLAGARYTGKSIYIGVLIKHLERLLEARGKHLRFVTPRKVYEAEYENPLYEARGMMPPTPAASTEGSSQIEPMILSIGTIKNVRHHLVLRDVAGEDIERPDADHTYLSYLAHSDAVFFLFDPSAVTDVRDLLRGEIPLAQQVGNPVGALDNVMSIIGPGSPPIAMIISKFDILQRLSRVQKEDLSKIMSNPGAAFLRDNRDPAARYDRADGELLHEELRSLLTRLNAARFVSAMTAPHHGKPFDHRFFAVSALGEHPDGKHLHARGIASFRCLDPVRWLFDKHGLFEKFELN